MRVGQGRVIKEETIPAIGFMDHLCLLFLMLSRLFIVCWERADLLALVGDVNCILLLSHVVSWLRCGT